MRLIPSDPDLATVVSRIRDATLDLQPDFQRGAVWSRPKQRLLIDSILRNWYVPPIHVVRTSDEAQVVLDGQQRLRAVADFVNGHFPVDGEAEPSAESIRELGGLFYNELPEPVRRRFDRFTIRIFEIVDYQTEEPYELFFRLNQPTPLTSAEKRNAFFGTPREQVKTLTEQAEASGMTPDRVGFSNARLAYEDLLARLLWTLEVGTLAEKVTASRVTERYRTSEPFASDVLDLASEATTRFFTLDVLSDPVVRLNRATAYSWLIFIARALHVGQSLDHFGDYVGRIESLRAHARRRFDLEVPYADNEATQESLRYPDPRSTMDVLLAILNDRATARVNDVSSVVLRDVVLWLMFYRTSQDCHVSEVAALDNVVSTLGPRDDLDGGLYRAALAIGWERIR